MIRKPLHALPEAGRDFDMIVDHYLVEAGERTAERFIDALDAAYHAIATDPQIGSTRYAHQLGLEGLRFRIVKGFPLSRLLSRTVRSNRGLARAARPPRHPARDRGRAGLNRPFRSLLPSEFLYKSGRRAA